MYFLNRTGETLSIALFNAGDPSREATLCGPDWWWNGQEITKYDIGNRDSFLVCVALGKERDFGTFRTSPTPVIKGTFNKGTKVIAKRKHGAAVGYSIENYELLDWSNIESNYINYTDVSTKSTNALDRSAEIAAKTIGAVGAGIALIPIPPFDLISGIMAIVSTIIDSSSTPSEDSSLDLPQITEAVREVVKVEINKQSADVAATQFVNVSNWLGDNCKPGALGAHSFKDFSRVLEETVQETSDFNTMLTHMARNPDEAQYILPIYAMGISSQVKLLWIHFAISVEDGDERNLAKYGIVLEKLVASREGLAHALQSATDYVKSTVEKLDAFDMVPETARLQSAIWRKLCGLSGPEKIIAHLAELEKIIERVNSDMANLKDGRDGVFWWKADWKTA